ncbi:MAG: leucyl aminopeptidase family protein [Xanthomonadales bacterium]|nr:leucyl aminopeptidase family protein [Xanthomonadales bacterium]
MPYLAAPQSNVIPLIAITPDTLEERLGELPEEAARWARNSGFTGEAGTLCLVPGGAGELDRVLFGDAGDGPLWRLAGLPSVLPAGAYRLQQDGGHEDAVQLALGWGLGAYRFDRYRKNRNIEARLVVDESVEQAARALLDAQCLVRDLVNTPTEDMGPVQLTDALQTEADRFDGEVTVIEGEALLDENYPAIHTVGRAAERPPRLAVLEWGDREAPLVVLIGKGVCFDTGGLNLKPGGSMALMKKDMGGAAHAIGLARLVMQAGLPVRLRVMIPAVENAVAGNAYRPGDVIATRLGKSVEIGNTDAEGRLVLCDALAEAMERKPDLVIDFATLTGAARVALGPDLPPVFSNDRSLVQDLLHAGDDVQDPLWQLPLHKPYLEMLKSEIADINNAGKGGFAGAITAALFLQEFVSPDVPWAHIDTFAWVPTARAGRPVGGEALGMRATFECLRRRYPIN